MARTIVSLLAVVGTMSCGMFRGDCAGVGLVRLSPLDTSIHVGQSFVIKYDEGGSCGPVVESDYHPVSLAWSTTDSLILRIGPDSGRVTALRIGDARAVVVERGLSVTVHVR